MSLQNYALAVRQLYQFHAPDMLPEFPALAKFVPAYKAALSYTQCFTNMTGVVLAPLAETLNTDSLSDFKKQFPKFGMYRVACSTKKFPPTLEEMAEMYTHGVFPDEF